MLEGGLREGKKTSTGNSDEVRFMYIRRTSSIEKIYTRIGLFHTLPRDDRYTTRVNVIMSSRHMYYVLP